MPNAMPLREANAVRVPCRGRLACPWAFEFHHFCLNLSSRNPESRHRHWQLKTTGACTARVDKEHSLPVFNTRTVGVPRDDCLKTGSSRVEIKVVDVVQDIEVHTVGFDYFGLR